MLPATALAPAADRVLSGLAAAASVQVRLSQTHDRLLLSMAIGHAQIMFG